MKIYSRFDGKIFENQQAVVDYYDAITSIQSVQFLNGRAFVWIADSLAEKVEDVPWLPIKELRAMEKFLEDDATYANKQDEKRVLWCKMGDVEIEAETVAEIMEFTGLTRYKINKILDEGTEYPGVDKLEWRQK